MDRGASRPLLPPSAIRMAKFLVKFVFGRKNLRPKSFRPKKFSVEKFAVRIAEGGSNGGGPGGREPPPVRPTNVDVPSVPHSEPYPTDIPSRKASQDSKGDMASLLQTVLQIWAAGEVTSEDVTACHGFQIFRRTDDGRTSIRTSTRTSVRTSVRTSIRSD